MYHISTTGYLLRKQILPQQKYMDVARGRFTTDPQTFSPRPRLRSSQVCVGYLKMYFQASQHLRGCKLPEVSVTFMNMVATFLAFCEWLNFP